MKEDFINKIEWPYPIKWNEEKEFTTDILILGGGIAGCWAAIAAAKKDANVILLEKGASIRSGAQLSSKADFCSSCGQKI